MTSAAVLREGDVAIGISHSGETLDVIDPLKEARRRGSTTVAITNYVRRNYGILIGEATAERIKHEIGSAFPGQEVLEISVKGRNLSEGVPRSFTLNSNEILEALQEPLQGIVGAVKEALEQTPPELGADVADRGIVLTGGGALLRDLDKLLMEETGLPVVIADDPMTCVARGGGRVIELIDEHGPAVFGLE